MGDYADLIQHNEDWLAREHVMRYRFAEQYLPRAGRVLDIACGPGYGTYHLARAAPQAELVGAGRSVDWGAGGGGFPFASLFGAIPGPTRRAGKRLLKGAAPAAEPVPGEPFVIGGRHNYPADAVVHEAQRSGAVQRVIVLV